jgi:hypothetical protein
MPEMFEVEAEGTYDEESDTFEWEEDSLTDVEADAMTLASAGWGTEEDYGYFGEDSIYYF